MMKTASIFNPRNDSLEERVRCYKSCLKALRNTKASLEYLNDKEWSKTLGSKQEIEYAHTIAQNSVNLAHQKVTQKELIKANEKGLINDNDFRKITSQKRQYEFQKARKKANFSKKIDRSFER